MADRHSTCLCRFVQIVSLPVIPIKILLGRVTLGFWVAVDAVSDLADDTTFGENSSQDRSFGGSWLGQS